MAKGKHSVIAKQKRGCLTGCLTRILVLLGIAAILFVGACMTGIISTDEITGEPKLSFERVHTSDFSTFKLDFSEIQALFQGLTQKIPALKWPYSVSGQGLTVKTLHAGSGECLLVCSDGYIMIADAGSGSGNWISGQMLLGGVKHINVLAALSSDDTNIGGMKTLLERYKPEYLIYQGSQIKSESYTRMMSAAEKLPELKMLAATAGMTFQLGRAEVTTIGPVSTYHTDSMDDGLSVRINYGSRRVLLLGTIRSGGAEELERLGDRIRADVLIAGNGGSALSAQLLSVVKPSYVFVTGVPDEAAISRARTWGAAVFTLKENGILTVHTDGENLIL